MPFDPSSMSPGSALQPMLEMLNEQAAAVKEPTDYYNGQQRLAFATAKFREAFSRYFPPLANNWMKIVVDTPVARLRVTGFRFDPDPDTPSWDSGADDDAWKIWQANNLDSRSKIAHTEAVKNGVCNILVSPPKPGRQPLITVELARQTFVYVDPADPRNRLAAVKRWLDDDGYAYATLYFADYIHKFRSVEKLRDGMPVSEVQWTRRQDDPVDANPIGVVPMIPLENKPDLEYGGRSDLEVAMPIQDAVNKFCLDMQVSSEFHAFPQRYVTGWEKAIDPITKKELTGKQVELMSSTSRLWRAMGENTKFGQLAPGDVANYIQPIEMYVDHLAAVTQTPAYYLKGKMANLSAEAIRAADAGLIDRVESEKESFSDGWEEVMRVAFLAKNDMKRGQAEIAEVLWAPAEVRDIAAVTDAAIKQRASLSVPLEFCWELLNWSPQKIKQAKAMMNLPDSPPAGNAGRDAAFPDQQAAQQARANGAPPPGFAQRASGLAVPAGQ